MKPYFLRFICRNFLRYESGEEGVRGRRGAPRLQLVPILAHHFPLWVAYPDFSGGSEPSQARKTHLVPPQAPLPVAPSAMFPQRRGSP